MLRPFDSCLSAWRNRPGPGLNRNGSRITGQFRRIRAKHLGHIRHVEHGQEHRNPLGNRGFDLVVQRLTASTRFAASEDGLIYQLI